jgi:hypothetical protein
MSKTPKFDEIYKAVSRLEYSYIKKYGPNSVRPRISVYIDHDYYHDVLNEITGEVSLYAYEFYEKGTIRSYPYHLVINSPRGNITFDRHSPWEVVLLSHEFDKPAQCGL